MVVSTQQPRRKNLPNHAVLLLVSFILIFVYGFSAISAVLPAPNHDSSSTLWTLSSSEFVPLVQLTQGPARTPPPSCPANTVYLHNTVVNDNDDNNDNNNVVRKIPRLVHLHLLGQPRCASSAVAHTIDAWRLVNHSVFLHDAAAVDRLLWRQWPEFPQLHQVHRCILHNTTFYKAELWRMLALWEYGGIYTDRNQVPRNFKATTIQPDDEAFFLYNEAGLLLSSFFAVAPRHPFLFFAIHEMTQNLLNMQLVDVPSDGAMTSYTAFAGAYKDYLGFEKYVKTLLYRSAQVGVVKGPHNTTIRLGGIQTKSWSYWLHRNQEDSSSSTPTTLDASTENMIMEDDLHGVSPKLASDYQGRLRFAKQKLACLEQMHMFDKVGGATSETRGLFHRHET